MYKRSFSLYLAMALLFFALLGLPVPSRAEQALRPLLADSAYDLINAVNALRASNGVPAYSISPILMYTAQSQADYMAATGVVTHTGAGGSSVTGRLLAAGYALAGDLSLGGFRSENIIGGTEGMSAQAAVEAWTGDDPHLQTMLSSSLSEIGAGVAVTGGRVYYVIDAALPKSGSEVSSAVTPLVVDGTIVPANDALISAVVLSTPDASGDVFHEVRAGQSLWQLAIEYKVKIDEIKQLNYLSSNDIYPGQKLLIKKGVVVVTETSTASPVVTLTQTSTATPMPTLLVASSTIAYTPTVLPASVPPNTNVIVGVTIGIIALALVGGGWITWLGRSKRE